GVCRRQRAQPHVPPGLQRHDRARRSGAGHVRPGGTLVPGTARNLLRHPRPDDAEPPGRGRRHAVPFGHLLPHAGPEGNGREAHRRAERRQVLGRADRDRGRAVPRLLPRRGLPPGVFLEQPGTAVLPGRGRAEGRQVPQAVRQPTQAVGRQGGRETMTRTLRLTLVGLAFAAFTPLAAPNDDGARPLFNGKDLAGWQNAAGKEPGKGWVVEDGALVRKERAGDLWTKERFGDFVLDLEFQTTGNSGVFIRTDDPGDNVQTGIEIQLERPAARPGKHSCGAVYDCLAPTKEASKDGWNRLVITARDNRLGLVLN